MTSKYLCDFKRYSEEGRSTITPLQSNLNYHRYTTQLIHCRTHIEKLRVCADRIDDYLNNKESTVLSEKEIDQMNTWHETVIAYLETIVYNSYKKHIEEVLKVDSNDTFKIATTFSKSIRICCQNVKLLVIATEPLCVIAGMFCFINPIDDIEILLRRAKDQLNLQASMSNISLSEEKSMIPFPYVERGNVLENMMVRIPNQLWEPYLDWISIVKLQSVGIAEVYFEY